MYSNSSFLSLFADERTVGLIYMIGAATTILGVLFIPYVVRKLGNYTTTLWLIIIQMVLLYQLIRSNDPVIIGIAFVLQYAVTALIAINMDIFLEVYTEGHDVGKVRGLYNAVLNASWVIAPFIGTMLINGTENYRNTYIAGFAILFPLMYLVFKNFPRFKDPHYTHLSPHQLIRHAEANRNWPILFSVNLLLQIFYAWMVVYSPIYLNKTIGFSWEQIGIIITVMLLPFPLIQYPLGRLADKKYGEKEIMIIGFCIMGGATILLSYITSHSVLVWAVALLLTRIGAASAEIMLETYFFKTVSPKDSPTLSLFRITRPLAYFFAPVIMGAGMLFAAEHVQFVFIGIITLLALIPIAMLKDTK